MLLVYRNNKNGETKRTTNKEERVFYDRSDDWELVYEAKDTQFKQIKKK